MCTKCAAWQANRGVGRARRVAQTESTCRRTAHPPPTSPCVDSSSARHATRARDCAVGRALLLSLCPACRSPPPPFRDDVCTRPLPFPLVLVVARRPPNLNQGRQGRRSSTREPHSTSSALCSAFPATAPPSAWSQRSRPPRGNDTPTRTAPWHTDGLLGPGRRRNPGRARLCCLFFNSQQRVYPGLLPWPVHGAGKCPLAPKRALSFHPQAVSVDQSGRSRLCILHSFPPHR